MRPVVLLACALGLFTFACASGEEKDPSVMEPEANSAKDDDDDDDRPSKRSSDDEEEPEEAAPARPATPTTPTTPPGTINRPTNTCETARDLGTIKGDEGGEQLAAEGTCSEWIKVRLKEADDGWLGETVKVKVTLTPAAGSDFELLAFVNQASDVQECRAPSGASESAGDRPETIQLEWGEKTMANGNDDSRTLSVFVKSASGACAAQPWKLLVEGNK